MRAGLSLDGVALPHCHGILSADPGRANPRKGLGRLLDRLAVARKDAGTPRAFEGWVVQ